MYYKDQETNYKFDLMQIANRSSIKLFYLLARMKMLLLNKKFADKYKDRIIPVIRSVRI